MFVFLEGQAFKIMGGFAHYKYSQDETDINSKKIPLIGIGFDSGLNQRKAHVVFDLMASQQKINFDFHKKRNYYNLVRLDLDLLFKYKFSKYSSPVLFFGGSVGLFIPTKTNAEGEKLKTDEKLNPLLDYGPVIGAGLELMFSDSKLGLVFDARYRMSIAELNLAGMKFKNKIFLITVGLKIY